MTKAQRRRVERVIDILLAGTSIKLSRNTCDGLQAYRAEHERMRQFIRNLADESRVYLESEE